MSTAGLKSKTNHCIAAALETVNPQSIQPLLYECSAWWLMAPDTTTFLAAYSNTTFFSVRWRHQSDAAWFSYRVMRMKNFDFTIYITGLFWRRPLNTCWNPIMQHSFKLYNAHVWWHEPRVTEAGARGHRHGQSTMYPSWIPHDEHERNRIELK